LKIEITDIEIENGDWNYWNWSRLDSLKHIPKRESEKEREKEREREREREEELEI